MLNKEKIADILKQKFNDPKFIEYCEKQRQYSSFDAFFEQIEKISNIDITDMLAVAEEDENKVKTKKPFTPERIKSDIYGFYRMIDEYAPGEPNLTKRIKENEKYIFIDNISTKWHRSSCGARRENDQVQKWIYVYEEGKIGDLKVAIHEVGHSLNHTFTDMEPIKDKRMDEIPSVIIDELSTIYLGLTHPELKEQLEADTRNRKLLSVLKARECLFEGLIIKAALGEISLEEIYARYGDELEQLPGMVYRKLDELNEHNGFRYLFNEAKYLVPHAMALKMRERFVKNPEEASKELKTLIEHVHDWNEEQALVYLELPDQEKLIDDYVDSFPKKAQKYSR